MKKTVSIILCICFVTLSLASCKGSKEANSATIADSVSYTYDSAYTCDDATKRAYNELCKAVIMGNTEVRMNSAFLDNALQLFYTSFPLNALVEKISPSENGYKIEYKTPDAHEKAMEFSEKIKTVKSELYSSNDTEYAINLYNSIASSIKVSDNSAITCYETIMTGEGTSFSYSNMFEYLLQQKGIKAYHILCEDESGASKAISMAELDGNLYYFDVFKEFEDNCGSSLKYFGMITDDISSYGLRNVIYTNRQEAADASDLRFDALRKCKKWEIKKEFLIITTENGEIVQIALN